jgi:hypothetical protein
MSVVGPSGERVRLERPYPCDLSHIKREFCGKDRNRWRWLNALILHEFCGWSYAEIGWLLGRDKSVVCRSLRRFKRQVRQRFGG